MGFSGVGEHYTPTNLINLLDEGIDRYFGIKAIRFVAILISSGGYQAI